MKRAIAFLSVALLCSAILASTAAAYVPRGSYVVGQWALASKGISSLVLRQRITLGSSSETVEEEIRVKKGQFVRRTLKSKESVLDYLLTPMRALRSTKGKQELATPGEILGPVGVLFYGADRAGLLVRLRQMGVDVEASRFVLFEGTPSMEIGQVGQSRIIFSKEPWVPLAAEWSGKSYRFESSRTSRHPLHYPERIEVREGEKRVMMVEVISVTANPVLGDEIFDPNRFQTGSPKQ